MNRRTLGFGMGLVLIVLTSSVVLVEVVLRIYAGAVETSLSRSLRIDPFAILVEPHGEVGYRPRPNEAFTYENGTKATINGMGFRGPEVTVPKPVGTFRIVLLGGSTTFGWGVDDGETIARYMDEALAARFPERAMEVVSLAFDGYDSYQLLERLRSDGLRLEPDAVIVNSGINDARNAWFVDIQDGDPRTLLYRATMEQARFEQALGRATLWSHAKHWLYLARLPGWLRTRGSILAVASADEAFTPAFHWEALGYFERNLGGLLELTTQLDSAVVLLSTPPSSLLALYEPEDMAPISYWVGDAQTTQAYRDSLSERMQAVARDGEARGLRVAYVPHDVLPRGLFLDDAHLTPEGNRRLAEDFVVALEPWLTAPATIENRRAIAGQTRAPLTTLR